MKHALALLLLAAPTWGTAETGSDRAPREPVASTAHFAFHSDLTTNLNDALIVAGQARAADRPELFAAGDEAACFAELPPSARSGWNLAVEWYSEIVSPAGWSERQQFLIRLELAGIADAPSGDPTEAYVAIARGFLAAATPAFTACRWPSQDLANRRWIEDLLPRLEAYGPAIAERLEKHYATPWHGLPIVVDVVATAPPVGANSIIRSPAGGHVLVASSIAGSHALETVFHEASHTLAAGWRGDPLPSMLAAAAEEVDSSLPRDLWHVVLFYTTGETVRQVLTTAGELGYRPYLEAFGLWDGRWGRYRAAVESVWPGYLSGELDLATASRELLRAIAASEGEPPATGGDRPLEDGR